MKVASIYRTGRSTLIRKPNGWLWLYGILQGLEFVGRLVILRPNLSDNKYLGQQRLFNLGPDSRFCSYWKLADQKLCALRVFTDVAEINKWTDQVITN